MPDVSVAEQRRGGAARAGVSGGTEDRRPQREPALVAVLAGGGGRRIGGSKPAAMLAGRALLDYPLAAAHAAGLQSVVVAKRSSPLPPVRCDVVHEPAGPLHPLCGIVAALRHAGGRPVLALGCDMPFLAPEMLRWLAWMEGAVVVQLHRRPQPLIARWLPTQLPALRQALADEAAMREIVASPPFTTVDERDLGRFGDPERLCFNVNDDADLQVARALAGR